MPLRRRAVTGKPARSAPRPDPRPGPARKPDNQPRQAGRGVTLGWPGFTPPSWPVFPPPLTADALARLNQHLWFDRVVTSAVGGQQGRADQPRPPVHPRGGLPRAVTPCLARVSRAEWAKSRITDP